MESKIIFGKMLDYYRLSNNLTMEELGLKVGKTKSAVSRWISGENFPKIDEIERLSEIFNTDVETLVFGGKSTSQTSPDTLTPTIQSIVDTSTQLEERRQENVLNYATEQLEEQNNNNIINLNSVREQSQTYSTSNKKNTKYGDVNLYGSISAGTGLDLYDEVIETVRYPKPIPKHDIALRVHGDSMEPMFRDEEIVFIKQTHEIHHGQVGAFIVNGMGFLKKFYRDKEGIRLVSLNRDYRDIVIGEYDDVHLVGTVVL